MDLRILQEDVQFGHRGSFEYAVFFQLHIFDIFVGFCVLFHWPPCLVCYLHLSR